LHERFRRRLFDRFPFELVGRPESAGPATGSAKAHKLEQARLIAHAFGDPPPDPASVLQTPSADPQKNTREESQRENLTAQQN